MDLYNFIPQNELGPVGSREIFLVDLDSIDLNRWLKIRIKKGYDQIPYLCLSGDMRENLQMSAFKAGAEDILPRDLHPSLICQRVVNLLRVLPALKREKGESQRKILLPGGQIISLNLEQRLVSRNDSHIKLTPREWDIFLILSGKINSVLSRETLLEALMGESSEGNDRLVDGHIKNLRRKLGDKKCIETERGYGYRLRGRVL